MEGNHRHPLPVVVVVVVVVENLVGQGVGKGMLPYAMRPQGTENEGKCVWRCTLQL